MRRVRCPGKQCDKERDVWDYSTWANMEMQCTENTNFQLGPISGHGYNFCFKDWVVFVKESWGKMKWSPFFLQSQRTGNPKFNSFTYPRRFTLPFHRGVWELQVEDKMVADREVRKGTASLPVTKALFREVFKGFLSRYIAQKIFCLHFFVVKILTWFLLLRFLKYFILNGHIASLIISNICPTRVQSSCCFSTLGLEFVSTLWSYLSDTNRGCPNTESLEHSSARRNISITSGNGCVWI